MMADVPRRLAQRLSKAMAKAIADDSKVQEVHDQARKAGFCMVVSLEANIGFAKLPQDQVLRAKAHRLSEALDRASTDDRRFLRSLRIAADDTLFRN
jgi:hypothetical protein